MVMLVWGAAGERTYETGTDRGVLYLPGQEGVPWSGLTAVNENPTGGDPKPYYIDGLKYLNLAASEEFEATIEAFSSPSEFNVCDGTNSISTGLFVTQQTRRPFNFSYRTKIGNDIDGVDHGYKIHLVYNALASPASRSHSSITDSVEPETLSWAITTTPPFGLSGIRPTAHFVVDSRRTPPNLLTYLENILYGTEGVAASMPTAQELVALFTSPGLTVRRNMIRGARGGSASYTDAAFGLGGTGTETSINDAVDGPVLPNGEQATSYVRFAITAANTGGSTWFRIGSSAQQTPIYDANTKFSTSMYIRSSQAFSVKASAYLYLNTVSAGNVALTPADDATINIPANTWVRISGMRKATASFDALRVSATFVSLLSLGQTIDITCGLSEVNVDSVGDYFDGSTPSANGITYSYESTPLTSRSIAQSWL